jgi:hypothetical protein
MRTISKTKVILCAAFFLATGACASAPVLAPAGSFGTGQTVQLDRSWSDLTATWAQNNKKVRLLTIDGILLNRLYVSQGLGAEEPLMIGPQGNSKNRPAPRPAANMSLSEQMEYVSRALVEIGYLRVETKNPRPVTVTGQRGIRFELSMNTTEGLAISGLAQAVNKNGLNYYIIYLAPSSHYYPANLPNAVKVMDSAAIQ